MKKFLSIVAIAVSLLAFGSCKKTENAGQSVVYFNDIKIDDPVCSVYVSDYSEEILFYILLAPDLAVKALDDSFRTIYIKLYKKSLGETVVVSPDPYSGMEYASYEEQPLSGKVTANSVDDHPGHFIIDFDFDLNFKEASGSITTERVIKLKGHVDKVFIKEHIK